MFNNVDNLRIDPYIYPSEEEKSTLEENNEPQPIEPQPTTNLTVQANLIPNNLLEEKRIQKICESLDILTLEQSEALLVKLIQGKIFQQLSALNILFIEVMSILRKISLDRAIISFKGEIHLTEGKKIAIKETTGKETHHLLTIEFSLLLRALHEYLYLNGGKTLFKPNRGKLIQAQEFYQNVVILFSHFEAIVNQVGNHQSQVLCRKLNKIRDVLMHLCLNESFLKKYSQPLAEGPTSEGEVMVYCQTSTHMQLYSDSLDVCLFSCVHFEMASTQLFQEVINMIKDLPQVCSQILRINDFMVKIEATRICYKNKLNKYLLSLQKVIIESKGLPTFKKLQTCFEQMNLHENHLLFIMKEMVQLSKSISVPWKLFLINERKFFNEFNEDSNLIYKDLENFVRNLRISIQKNKQIRGENLKKVNTLLCLVDKIHDNYISRVNSFIIASMLVPATTQGEMDAFFSLSIDLLNKKADTFHQSLFLQPNTIPFSAFSALDLLFHQLYYVRDVYAKRKNSEELMLIEEVIHVFKRSINDIQVIQCPDEQQMILNISESVKKEYVNNSYELILKIINFLSQDTILPVIENFPLMQIVLSLKNYLENFDLNKPLLRSHFTCTLFLPLSNQVEISSTDIPLIQRQMQLIVQSMSDQNIVGFFDQLEKETFLRKTDNFFWNLSYKRIALGTIVVKKMQKILHQCYRKIQISKSTEEVLLALHEWNKRIDPLCENIDKCAFQITLLGKLAEQEKNQEVYQRIALICSWHNWFCFLISTINEIVKLNPEPKQAYLKDHIPFKDFEEVLDEVEENEVPAHRLPLQLPQESYIPSSFETHFNLLKSLQTNQPSFFNEEETEVSLFIRTVKPNELIENSTFYLTLIEEGKKWRIQDKKTPLSILRRAEMDHILLLEATEKIALSFIRMAATHESRHIHIISSTHYENRPLIYTHNGELLTHLLCSANKQWFNHPDLLPAIQYQQLLLKKIYWFQEDQKEIENIALISTCCENVWKELPLVAHTQKRMNAPDKMRNIQDCRIQIHKFKRKRSHNLSPINLIDLETLKKSILQRVDSLKINPECSDKVQNQIQGIKRVLNFHQDLIDFESQDMALFFAMRSAEIQVNLLNHALILVLSTIKDQPHPLFSENKGRSLLHTHQVEKLWSVLKNYLIPEASDVIEILDTYLPLFTGDPRYPYPNKYQMTDQLVQMQEKVYLLIKLESGWLGSEEQRLLIKHIGKGWKQLSIEVQKVMLKNKILQAREEQRQKNHIAFHLSELILNITIF